NDLKEVVRRNGQCADERILNRAGHPGETPLVVLPFENMDLGERHRGLLLYSSPRVACPAPSAPWDAGQRHADSKRKAPVRECVYVHAYKWLARRRHRE